LKGSSVTEGFCCWAETGNNRIKPKKPEM